MGSVLLNWTQTLEYEGEQIWNRTQRFFSPEKMLRVIGQQKQQAMVAGIMPVQEDMDAEALIEKLKRVKESEFYIVIGMYDFAPTARQAVTAQLLQFMAAGMPVPPEIVVKAAAPPYEKEILEALKTKGMQLPNEALSKVLGAGQGQAGQPDGVNK